MGGLAKVPLLVEGGVQFSGRVEWAYSVLSAVPVSMFLKAVHATRFALPCPAGPGLGGGAGGLGQARGGLPPPQPPPPN